MNIWRPYKKDWVPGRVREAGQETWESKTLRKNFPASQDPRDKHKPTGQTACSSALDYQSVLEACVPMYLFPFPC